MAPDRTARDNAACRLSDVFWSVCVFTGVIVGAMHSKPATDTSAAGDLIDFVCGSNRRNLECAGNCDDIHFSVAECRCDADCHKYGDCCYDQRTSCPVAGAAVDVDAAPPPQSPYKCHAHPQGYRAQPDFNSGIWLRSTCSGSWTGPEHVRRLCEADEEESAGAAAAEEFRAGFLRRLPVYSRASGGEHYRNMHCARCNMVPASQRTYYHIDVTCYDNQQLELITGAPPAFGTRNKRDIDNMSLFAHIQRLVEVDKCRVAFRVPEGQSVPAPRTCFRRRVIDTCSPDYTDTAVISLCNAYAGYVNEFSGLYKNPHCAACNHEYEDILSDTSSDVRPVSACRVFLQYPSFRDLLPTLSFFILFDTSVTKTQGGGAASDSGSTLVDCPSGTVWDRALLACRLETDSYTYTVHITGTSNASLLSDDVVETINEDIGVEINRRLAESTDLTGSAAVSVQTVDVRPSYQVRVSNDLATLSIDPAFILTTEITYTTSPLSEPAEVNGVINQTLAELVSSEQRRVYGLPDVNDTFTLTAVTSSGAQPLISRRPCDKLVLANVRNYTLIDASSDDISVSLDNSDVILNTSEYLIHDDVLFVCEQSYKRYFVRDESRTALTSVSWVGTLTFVLTILSLLCLAVGLVTHVILKEMHTLAGVNLCSLMMWMMVSQVMLLVQQYDVYSIRGRNSGASCTAVALILHYAFLTFFAWMNVCAFSIYNSFTRLFETRHMNARKSYIKYSMFAYLTPLLVVGVTGVIHYTRTATYGVTAAGFCWFVDISALLAAFGAPILLVIFSNAYFFIRVVLVIRGRPASLTSDKRQTNAQNFFILVRITVLMGFTWIFPFLALIPHGDALSYRLGIQLISDILSSLQGTMIFVAFIVRSRVYHSVKDKIQGHVRGVHSSGSSTSRPTSNTTNIRQSSQQQPSKQISTTSI